MAARVIPVPPEFDTGQMAEQLSALERAVREFADHYDELLEQYPDQWVAVMMDPHAGRTVLSNADFEELCREIDNRQLPLGQAYIRFMAKEPRAWIL